MPNKADRDKYWAVKRAHQARGQCSLTWLSDSDDDEEEQKVLNDFDCAVLRAYVSNEKEQRGQEREG
jgi:hypothetical protein